MFKAELCILIERFIKSGRKDLDFGSYVTKCFTLYFGFDVLV